MTPQPPGPATRSDSLADEVDVWKVDLAQQPSVEAISALRPDERERAARLISAQARARYLTGRSALRSILGAHLGVSPGALVLLAPPGEKPRLADPVFDLRFNLTHAGDMALLAVTVGREVGIDLEPLDAGTRLLDLATVFLSPDEYREIETLSGEDLVSHLTKIWVRKEAFAKAIGAGLRIPLAGVEFKFAGPWGVAQASLPSTDGRSWAVSDLEFIDRHAAAVAIEGTESAIRVFEWPASLDEVDPAPGRSTPGETREGSRLASD